MMLPRHTGGRDGWVRRNERKGRRPWLALVGGTHVLSRGPSGMRGDADPLEPASDGRTCFQLQSRSGQVARVRCGARVSAGQAAATRASLLRSAGGNGDGEPEPGGGSGKPPAMGGRPESLRRPKIALRRTAQSSLGRNRHRPTVTAAERERVIHDHQSPPTRP